MSLRLTPLAFALAAAFSAQAQVVTTEVAPQRVTVTGDKPADGYAAPKTTVAGKVAVSRREIPNSVSVLTREQMDDQNLVTPWDALNQITGVTPIANDLTQQQFHSRGTSLEMQQDGMPSSLPLSGYQQFDLAVYERLEVLRGPSGLLQGSGGFGGTVNMVHKRPKAEFAASGVLGLGSWNNRRLEVDVSTPLNAAKTLRARAVASVVDRGYFIDRAWDKKWLVYGVVEADVSPATTLGLTLAHQSDLSPSYTGQPAYTNGQFLKVPRSFNPYPDWTRYKWETAETAVDLTHRFSADWKLVAKYTHRDQGFYFHDSYPTTGVTPVTDVIANYARREFTYDYTLDSADAYLSGKVSALGGHHDVLLGYNFSSFESVGQGVNPNQTASLNFANVPLANPPAVPEPSFVYKTGSQSQTTQSGLYSQLRSRFSFGLTTVLGARWTNYQYRSHSVAPATPTAWAVGGRETGELTPYAGALYDLSKHQTAYISYSDIFVPQTQVQTDGSTLQPRVGGQWEVGAKGEYDEGRLTTAVAIFEIKDRNRAYQLDPKPAGCPASACYVALGEVQSKGWEFEVAGRLTPQWSATAGYSRLDTRQTKTSTATNLGLPISFWYPRHQFKLWSQYKVASGALQGLAWGLGVNASSASASGTSTATVAARTQPKYAVVNTQASYPVNKMITATLAVNNLFDKTYYTRLGGTNTYNTVGEPRNVQLALRVGL